MRKSEVSFDKRMNFKGKQHSQERAEIRKALRFAYMFDLYK